VKFLEGVIIHLDIAIITDTLNPSNILTQLTSLAGARRTDGSSTTFAMANGVLITSNSTQDTFSKLERTQLTCLLVLNSLKGDLFEVNLDRKFILLFLAMLNFINLNFLRLCCRHSFSLWLSASTKIAAGTPGALGLLNFRLYQIVSLATSTWLR
jgi:hypothetical protein